MDESSGTSYESGYYDENGRHYDAVSFEKNGTYENVVYKCEYCGQDAVVNLSADDAVAKSVNCPNCGAPMSIRSELDEAVEANVYEPAENTHEYQSEESLKAFRESSEKRKKRSVGKTILVVLVVLLGIGRIYGHMQAKKEPEPTASVYTQQLITSADSVALVYKGDHVYATASNADGADKTLVWDAEADSYYDADSECWLWYNTDVSPEIWQYWYEGISSDYGDYGWMEHDADGWWIEASYDNWIQLPEQYDASDLWYIDD